MISNQMYEKSMALIYKDNKVVGWMSTDKEADMFCEKHHAYSWDFYYPHKEYINLSKLIHMNLYSVN